MNNIEEIYELFNKHTVTSETDINGRITYVSDPFIKISGYSKNELIGKTHRIVRHEDMPDSVFKEMWETITAKKVWKGEVKNRAKNGNHYWVDSVVFPLLDENENITGYKSIRVDITLEKEAYDLLENLIGKQSDDISV